MQNSIHYSAPQHLKAIQQSEPTQLLGRSSGCPLFGVDAEEYGHEDDEGSHEGLGSEGVAEHDAAHDDGQDLSAGHYYREHHRTEGFNAVEDEKLS